MYPVLNKCYALVKQYENPLLYKVFEEEGYSHNSNSIDIEVINKTACEILEKCNGIHSIDEISQFMSIRYNEDYSNVKAIVSRFIETSLNNGFVTMNVRRQLCNIYVCGSYDTITPLSAGYEITKACPLKCIHCYNKSGLPKIDELSTEDVIIILKKLKIAGVMKLNITGGEPMARKDFFEIIEFCSQNFFAITINSNGYFITMDAAEKISKMNHNVIFQISIDGTEETHNNIRGKADAFKKATKAVEYLAKMKVPVTVGFTCNKDNFNEIEQVTKLAKQLGAIQISFAKTMNSGRAKDNKIADNVDIDKLAEVVHNMRLKYSDNTFYVGNADEEKTNDENENSTCGAGTRLICVRENGDVTPCTSMLQVMGNIKRQEITELFSVSNIEVFNTLIRPNKNFCDGCNNTDVCIGCNAAALELDHPSCKWMNNNNKELSKLKLMPIYEY